MTTFRQTTVTAANGAPFTVLLLDAMKPGPNAHRHTGKGMHDTVEFYDARYVEGFSEFGQFVSSYHLTTIMERPDGTSLNLDGGVPDWTIDAETMHLVWLWLNDQVGEMIEADLAEHGPLVKP